jgi:hypothetical protein
VRAPHPRGQDGPVGSTGHGGDRQRTALTWCWHEQTPRWAEHPEPEGRAGVKLGVSRRRLGTDDRRSAVVAARPSPASSERPVRVPIWGSVLLGTLGYWGMVVTGTRLGPLPNPPSGQWWFHLPPGHLGLLRVLFYVGAALAVAGWLGVGVEARRGRLSTPVALLALVLWSVPLLLGPPIFSKDIYSYIGQGLIAHRGLDPYSIPPSALGHGPLLNSIASVWRHSPAPYGPVFVELARGVTVAVGSSIVPEVLALRGVEVVGMVLLAIFVPRLARQVGTDPQLATWLGVLSPLVLLSYMASGHNDCLMMGLVVLGVSLWLDDRRVVALVLCTLATMVKASAGAAVIFLVADELRLEGGRRRVWRLAVDAAVVVATVVGATLASGLGWRWLLPSNLRIPAEVRIDATPTVSLGTAINRLLGLVHLHVAQSGTITVVQAVAGVLAAAGAVWLLWRVRRDNLVRVLAVVLLLAVLAGPTLWPWYLSWGLILLATTSSQTSKVLVVAAAASILLAGPVGSAQLSGYWYWPVAITAVVGCAWLASGRRWTRVLLRPSSAP